MKTDPEAAAALLLHSDPVQLDELVSADGLCAARAEIELQIARTSSSEPGTPTLTPTPMPAPRRRPSLPVAVPYLGRGTARRTVVLGGAALVAAGCVLLALPGSRAHDGGLLSETAALAAEQPPSIAPPGQYYYVQEQEVQTHSSSADDHVSARWWVANDGSGRVTYSFKLNALPAEGYTETFGPGKYDSVAYPSVKQMLGHHAPPTAFIGAFVPINMRLDPESLPTDPGALSNALRAAVAEAGRLSRYSLYGPSGFSEAAKELFVIAYALQDPMDPPALRSALFTIAGELPGIAVQQGVTDPLGRSGEAITVSTGPVQGPQGPISSAHYIFAVIFDPKTTQILAETSYASDHPEQATNDYTVFTGQVVTASDTTPSETTGTTTTPTTTTSTTATSTTTSTASATTTTPTTTTTSTTSP